MNKDFQIPEGLSARGEQAAHLVRGIAASIYNKTDADDLDLGGCRAFYTPKEWKERGEPYGKGACLIICHDGGDLAPVFNLDYESYMTYDTMFGRLLAEGFLAEQMYGWCTAIYDEESEQ